MFIDPGSPWQNAWIESFNSRFRDELLNLWIFDSLIEATEPGAVAGAGASVEGTVNEIIEGNQ